MDNLEAEREKAVEALRHADKMRKKKAARDRMLAGKTVEKGLLIVHTGKGKGKSTAAFGLVLRALGHNFKVAVIQFIKGIWDTGERRILEQFQDQLTFSAMGAGFTWETQDRAMDMQSARAAFDKSRVFLSDPSYKLVILDELNVVLRHGYLSLDDVLPALQQRPEGMHVVVTGRNAPEELIEMADLVTEMTLIKHPFRQGVKAQAGIEF